MKEAADVTSSLGTEQADFIPTMTSLLVVLITRKGEKKR